MQKVVECVTASLITDCVTDDKLACCRFSVLLYGNIRVSLRCSDGIDECGVADLEY
jgi:hypothetical protein